MPLDAALMDLLRPLTRQRRPLWLMVSEMLGHSNIYITLDLYSHVTPTMQKEVAVALDTLLRQ